jgi:hypothetical protein
VIVPQVSGELVGQALNPVSLCMVAAGAQLLGRAAPVPERAVGGAAGAPLLVGPEPGPAATRPVRGEVSVQPFDSVMVVEQHRQSAEQDPLAWPKVIGIRSPEAVEGGGGHAEGVSDLVAEVELAG